MTDLIKRDDALAAIQEYAVQEVGAFRTPDLKGAADTIRALPVNPVIKELLRDDRFESKDWKHADAAGRIEWLITMFESKTEEVAMWVDMINGEAN